jgi:hypothetical protein
MADYYESGREYADNVLYGIGRCIPEDLRYALDTKKAKYVSIGLIAGGLVLAPVLIPCGLGGLVLNQCARVANNRNLEARLNS